ncbi:MAG TPA: 6,7-dimethyl-8-ribityllumazine synthase [Chthoniobacteraceae bacterium]|jgi:6,7-dimethyl-8-ribityllumazine synthase
MANIIPSRPRQIGSRRTFAIVASNYHQEYVDGMIAHVERELDVIAPGGFIQRYDVPGAFEIPLIVQEVALRGGVDVIIALGVIIEGETAHGSLIGETITKSLQQLSITHRLPIVHEVLLMKDEAQARVRCLEEEMNRGTEAARVAVRMIEAMGVFSSRR